MSRVRELMKQFSGGGAPSSASDENETQSRIRRSPSTVSVGSMQSGTSVTSETSCSKSSRGRAAGGLSVYDEMLRQQRLAREQDRNHTSEHWRTTARSVGGGLGLMDQGAALARQHKQEELKAKTNASALAANCRGAGTVNLMESATLLARQQKENELKAKTNASLLAANCRGAGTVNLMESATLIARESKQIEHKAKADAAERASGFRGVGDRFQEELRSREAVQREQDRKAREEMEQSRRNVKGSGQVCLMDQATVLERERKAQDAKAREELERLKRGYKGTFTFLDAARFVVKQAREKDRLAREDAQRRAAAYKAVGSSRLDQEVSDLDRQSKQADRNAVAEVQQLNAKYRGAGGNGLLEQAAQLDRQRKERDRKAEEEIRQLKQMYRGSGSPNLLDQAAELERKRKAEDVRARAEIELLKAQSKTPLGLMDKPAMDERRLREEDKQAVRAARDAQARFRGVSVSIADSASLASRDLDGFSNVDSASQAPGHEVQGSDEDNGFCTELVEEDDEVCAPAPAPEADHGEPDEPRGSGEHGELEEALQARQDSPETEHVAQREAEDEEAKGAAENATLAVEGLEQGDAVGERSADHQAVDEFQESSSESAVEGPGAAFELEETVDEAAFLAEEVVDEESYDGAKGYVEHEEQVGSALAAESESDCAVFDQANVAVDEEEEEAKDEEECVADEDEGDEAEEKTGDAVALRVATSPSKVSPELVAPPQLQDTLSVASTTVA